MAIRQIDLLAALRGERRLTQEEVWDALEELAQLRETVAVMRVQQESERAREELRRGAQVH